MADAERGELTFDSQDLGMQGITEEERHEIEADLNQMVSQTVQPPALPRQFAFPQRSGLLLPALVWTTAAAVAAGGYFFLQSQFETRENDITVEGRTFFGAEAELLSSIIEENERRLAEKDEEINQIQGQLALLNQERAQFEQDLEEQIAQREAELQEQLAAELEAERARLASEGISDEEISTQIASLQNQRQLQLEEEVATLQASAEAQLSALEAQLSEQQSALEQELEESRVERDQIVSDANQRVAEAEARAQQVEQALGEEIEALEQAEQEALLEVQRLQSQQQSDQLLTDRVLGSFAVILDDIQEGLSDQAIEGLDSLERLLLDQRAAGATQRVDTELALASTLRGLVREVDVLRQNLTVRDLTTTDAEIDELERARAIELIETAAETATLAEQARGAGRFTEARTLYQQALGTIPSLQSVYPGILDLEANRRELALQTAISQAQTLLAAGQANGAVESYLTGLRTIAANEADPLIAVAGGIEAAIGLTTEELLDLQDEIQAELDSTIAAQNLQISTLQNQLASAQAQATTAVQRLTPLEESISTLETENEQLSADLAAARATTNAADQGTTELQDQLADLQGELAIAQTRSESLQQQVDESQEELSDVRAALATAEARAEALEQELASAAAETPQPADAPEETVDSAELVALQEELAAAAASVAELEQQLATSTETGQRLQSELDESETESETLREQVAALRETRDASTTTVDELEAEVSRLTQELVAAEDGRGQLENLRSEYQRAFGQATTQLNTGRAEVARRTLLSVLSEPDAADLFPDLTTTIERAHRTLVQEAEAAAETQARMEAISDALTLVDEIQENIDEPREAASVQSYLRREPDLQDLGTELFEIVELSSRQISVPEIDFRLLGSVSRVTGSLIVVERLVTTPTEVGASVELRRTPTLGQEIPIARGTVLEVSDDRILVSAGEIYDLSLPPQLRDVVYIEQQ